MFAKLGCKSEQMPTKITWTCRPIFEAPSTRDILHVYVPKRWTAGASGGLCLVDTAVHRPTRWGQFSFFSSSHPPTGVQFNILQQDPWSIAWKANTILPILCCAFRSPIISEGSPGHVHARIPRPTKAREPVGLQRAFAPALSQLPTTPRSAPAIFRVMKPRPVVRTESRGRKNLVQRHKSRRKGLIAGQLPAVQTRLTRANDAPGTRSGVCCMKRAPSPFSSPIPPHVA